MKRKLHQMVWLSFLAAACSGTGNEPKVKPCTGANSVGMGALAVGGYASTFPGVDGCVSFPANATADTIEYLVVAQSAAADPNQSAHFLLSGDTVQTQTTYASWFQAEARASENLGDQFHTFLRESEEARAYVPGLLKQGPPALQSNLVQPPQVGDLRTFSVCRNLICNAFDRVRAIVKAVGTHAAIFVDTISANQLNQADFDSLEAVFDNRIYALDTLAFGAESDVDANGIVIVLMTPTINRLVTASQCTTQGFVSGYFFGADLDPLNSQNTNYNQSELFYTLVPDATGQFSCAHDAAQVRRILPITFVHEFQHMISFNQHVLTRGGATEVLWLNEAMSHYAEELGGRSYLPGDSTTFSNYLKGNVYNGYQYLDNTGATFLVATAGNGSLAERGSGWLFVRYVIDQLATSNTVGAWNAVTRQLVRTASTGATNVQARTGQPFDQTVAKWALALWVSDMTTADGAAASFTPPPELRYKSWAFRTTYASLHTQTPGVFVHAYPLIPGTALGPDVNLGGTLRSGSGVYQRVQHPPGKPSFTLQLAGTEGAKLPTILAPRITAIRVR